jgi:hypothetical protein
MKNASNSNDPALGPEHNGSNGNRRRGGKGRIHGSRQSKDDTDRILSELQPEELMLHGSHEYENPAEAASDAETKSVETAASRGQVQILLGMFSRLDLIRSPDGRAFARVIVSQRDARDQQGAVPRHFEVWGLDTQAFEGWVLAEYYRKTKGAPSEQALKMFVRTLKARASVEGRHAEVYIRVGTDGIHYYLDLCNRAWQVVEITTEGWEVRDESPIAFRRSSGMLPLAVPTRGGLLSLLRPFVNLASDDDFKLLVVWLLASLRPLGPYPLLILQGEQGSAKSTTSRVLRRLVDPHAAPLRCEPKSQQDLMIAANSSWLIAFDNLSGVKASLSDALCRLATGGGFATRTLYSNDDETHFYAMRPMLLNGIDDVADRPDLLDRAIQLRLPMIPDTQRQEEAKFWSKFDANQGLILGSLLSAYCAALKELPNVELDRLPRMADFARFGEAVGRDQGWEDGAFLRAYTNNSLELTESALEASLVARTIGAFMATRPIWEGTCATLLHVLKEVVSPDEMKSWGWPKSPRKLSSELARLAPVLRKLGFDVTRPTTKSNKGRMLVITKAHHAPIREQQSQQSQQSLDFQKPGFASPEPPGGVSGLTPREVKTANGQHPDRHDVNIICGKELREGSDGNDGRDGSFEAGGESDNEEMTEWNS